LLTSSRSLNPRQAQAILRKAADPAWFVREVLRHDPWETPVRVMRSVARPRSLTAVKACHASAKTFTAAEVVLWWVFVERGIAITTAPTWSQVRKLLWAEIHKAHASAAVPLGGHLNQVELTLSPDVYAMGLSTNEGVRFQGFHGKVLIVIDEAPGVREDIFEAIDGIRAGGDVRVLMQGNPLLPSGRFFEAFTVERSLWDAYTVNAFNTPNLRGVTVEDLRAIPLDDRDHPLLHETARPYLVTRSWVHEKLHTWGERSPLWKSKVLGEFPDQGDDSLLSLVWLDRASAELIDSPIDRDLPAIAGVDVAGPGEDETVLYVRQGGCVVDRRVWLDPDPRGELIAALREWRIERVNVDAIGVGWYLAKHLADAGFAVEPINVAERADDSEHYANRKAELYWGLRMRFEAGEITGLDDDVTVSQLSTIRYKHNARGQVQIESKDEAKKRGIKSPDRAEALMLAFAPERGGTFEAVPDDLSGHLARMGL
jgi:hypothetical protein